MTETAPGVCPVHPNREALLRCNRCDRLMCTECAVLTPTGYRCRECISKQQKVFDTAQTIDFPLAFLVALILSLLGSAAIWFFGFWGVLAGPLMGMLIPRVIRPVTGRRRSKALFLTASAGVLTGALPLALFYLLSASWLAVLISAAYAFWPPPPPGTALRGIRLG